MKKGICLASLTIFFGLVVAFASAAKPLVVNGEIEHQDPYTFILDSSNNGFLPSASGSGQSDASNSPKTANGNPIIFSYVSAFKSGNRIRMVKNSGNIANVTPFTDLKAITVVIPSGNVSLAYGSSYANYSDPISITSGVRYEIDHMPYFKIIAGSSTPYIDSITVEYLCGGSGELDPVSAHTHHGYHYFANEPTATKAGNLEFYACSECQYVSLTKDDGVYLDAVLTYELPINHIAYIGPGPWKQPTQFDYPIAVNLEVPSEGYSVDQTGSTDASSTIQSALNYVEGLGGGTVYIPAGKYLLANQITIPNRVTLVGDFKGVGSDDYGTVFLCTKSPDGTGSKLNNSQIIVTSNASINGVTFYYPNQDIEDVIEYGPTLYAYNNFTATLSNLFFINSYYGIAVNDVSDTGGELVNIENVYGTCLHDGITGYYQSDVGYWNNINLSPSFYATALSDYRCSDSSLLYKYTRTYLTALTLSDLDDFSFNKIRIDNAKIGIFFPTEVNRPLQAFWGLLNDVQLNDCLTGVYATKIFGSGAALFTHSKLGKIINVSSTGFIKLSKCSYDEILGTGNTLIEEGSETYEAAPSYDDSHTFNIPKRVHYIDSLDDQGITDVSADLQAEIDSFTGGGLIVLKNGTYRLNNPITIPSNTIITSFGNSYTRTTQGDSFKHLVKFISYSSDSCVKLGTSAGINGIHIFNVYQDPEAANSVLSASGSDPYVAVKGIGNNSFAINTEVVFAFTAFDFSGVNNHYVKYCYGSAYDTFIKSSGSGKIINTLSNISFISRSCLISFARANQTMVEKYSSLENPSKAEEHDFTLNLLRTYSTMVKTGNGDEFILHCFSYGVKTLIEATSTTLLVINGSQDNVKDDNYMYIINGGSVKIVDSLRVFGHSFLLTSGHLEIYGRFDFNNRFEKYYNSDTSSDDNPSYPIAGLVEDVLNYCENTTGISGASRNGSYKYQGSYSWRGSSTGNPAISYTFTSSPRNISQYMNKGYLRFYVYCTNIKNKGTEAFVELTSGGTCDANEITLNVINQIKVSGWNEILIKLSDMETGPGTFDPHSLNYFRFYVNGSNGYYYIDYISFFHEVIPANQIILNECEEDTGTAAISMSDFRMQGSYSFMSNDTVNTTFFYSFSAIDISSYMSTGYLSFYFYVPHRDLLGSVVQIELTSSGIWDNQEITCSVKEYITEDGWNHVQIPLANFYKGSENEFNSSACNCFRLYTLGSNCHFYLDDIRLVK